MSAAWPCDAVLVGHVSTAYGIKGWLKIHPYSSDADALLNNTEWWVKFPAETEQAAKCIAVNTAKWHNGAIVAQWETVADRTAAEACRGLEIWLSRATFPAPAEDEYYLFDLQGLRVCNLQGVVLGQVQEVFDNGAHDVLVVQDQQRSVQRMIPFVSAYVVKIDQQAGDVLVDWQSEWDEPDSAPPKPKQRVRKPAVEA
ncbi:ribosome maturation factor RimM [Parvibium lacunae]|uniref:Ribosome maturation factor RimM n=1 Tax=Parvibium lacunae TaxID=1888893 RepID=A0A368L4B1_9BURK|nr:ribosome maturation factor RimM [Parvibium lacunae]RCS58409.1 ribosome maturation factor RimM [Parvibium lacunae]